MHICIILYVTVQTEHMYMYHNVRMYVCMHTYVYMHMYMHAMYEANICIIAFMCVHIHGLVFEHTNYSADLGFLDAIIQVTFLYRQMRLAEMNQSQECEHGVLCFFWKRLLIRS